MVLLSFSVKEDELLNGTKIRTTRLYNKRKYECWKRTTWSRDFFVAIPMLQCWWKPRTKYGYKLFDRLGRDIYRLQFRDLNGRPWPYRERDNGLFTPMTTDEFKQYLREEGFENQPMEFLRFFEDHYAPLDGVIFQSIAFPPVVL